jgi:hypothetical protein
VNAVLAVITAGLAVTLVQGPTDVVPYWKKLSVGAEVPVVPCSVAPVDVTLVAAPVVRETPVVPMMVTVAMAEKPLVTKRA